jgi:hypothetical protein
MDIKLGLTLNREKGVRLLENKVLKYLDLRELKWRILYIGTSECRPAFNPTF